VSLESAEAAAEPVGRISPLNRDGGGPLHAQIRDILHRQIVDMALSPGSSLPTEEELQRQFGVSRSVVRQALSGLSDLGLIRRQRGRGSARAAWTSKPRRTASVFAHMSSASNPPNRPKRASTPLAPPIPGKSSGSATLVTCPSPS
jgi:DNA-binding transcriptional regulator YhcF (GntR family)